MQNSTDLNQEILNLEKKYWNAMCDSNLDSIIELTDFPCLLANAHGSHAFEKEEFKSMFESGKGKIESFKFEDNSVEVRQVSSETAVIAYKVKSTFLDSGKNKTVEAVDTSTWVKRGGKWVCAMHTETELPS